jgi:hypothetical protein
MAMQKAYGTASIQQPRLWSCSWCVIDLDAIVAISEAKDDDGKIVATVSIGGSEDFEFDLGNKQQHDEFKSLRASWLAWRDCQEWP